MSLTSCLDHLLESNEIEHSNINISEKSNEKIKVVEREIENKIDNSSKLTYKNISGKYAFASQRLLTVSELQHNNWTEADLSIMRSEIYARHGYKFKAGGKMDKYFRKEKWYNAQHDEVSSFFSDIEKQNIIVISTIEAINQKLASTEDNIPQLEDEAGGYGNILVENLRLRDKPALEGETIALLKKNSLVTVKGESAFKTTIELNGQEISDVWFKIISEEGKTGWVHGCCIEVTWP